VSEAWETFLVLFGTTRNIWLGIGSIGLLFILGVGLPTSGFDWKKHYKENLSPYLSLVWCSIAVWVPGLRPGPEDGHSEMVAGIDGSEIGFRIVLGILLAATSYFVYRTLPIFSFWIARKFLPERVAKVLEKAVRTVW
jgi:hypothetical protein